MGGSLHTRSVLTAATTKLRGPASRIISKHMGE
jgi:hypothetical protein